VGNIRKKQSQTQTPLPILLRKAADASDLEQWDTQGLLRDAADMIGLLRCELITSVASNLIHRLNIDPDSADESAREVVRQMIPGLR
jgi:hypothetical protein